jgi:hypothetical protein
MVRDGLQHNFIKNVLKDGRLFEPFSPVPTNGGMVKHPVI